MRLPLTLVLAAGLLAGTALPGPARADNQMGYRLLSPQDAAALPRNHGVLGLEVGRAQQITDAGMTFDVMLVKQVRPGSPGARGGLVMGDQIIAVDGRVFPSIVAFASYVGSLPPGSMAAVDYMPARGGPAQAQRVTLLVAAAGAPAPAKAAAPEGMSTGTKVAIGVGAAALFGCYEMGCFSHHTPAAAAPQR